MITNEFFKGYFQALSLIEDIVNDLNSHYSQQEEPVNSTEALEAVVSAIKGVRTSYQDIVIKLNRDMNEDK